MDGCEVVLPLLFLFPFPFKPNISIVVLATDTRKVVPRNMRSCRFWIAGHRGIAAGCPLCPPISELQSRNVRFCAIFIRFVPSSEVASRAVT